MPPLKHSPALSGVYEEAHPDGQGQVGIIGCGNISAVYITADKRFEILEIVAVSDIIPERSAKRAADGRARAVTNEEILADPEIEIVLT